MVRLGEELSGRLQRKIAEIGDGSTVPLDLEEARTIAEILGNGITSLHSRLENLQQMQAVARAVWRHGTGNPATKMRKALAYVVDRESRGKRGPSIEAGEVIRDYHALTNEHGRVTIWHELERVFNLPGTEIQCPLTPEDAIKTLARHHGFASYAACLRFLQRQRKVLEAEDQEQADLMELIWRDDAPARRPSWSLQALRTLPHEW